MKAAKSYIVALVFLVTGFALTSALTAYTERGASLFTSLSTDDGHRAALAIKFGKAMLERGHPLTVFLNDKSVMIASKTKSAGYAEQQSELAALIGKGVTVIACEHCLHDYGLTHADLLDGIKTGMLDVKGGGLLKAHTHTMAW
jgi:sulfur relay (sulfurtransferase) complex TusBCD TusD component (DsrE family)